MNTTAPPTVSGLDPVTVNTCADAVATQKDAYLPSSGLERAWVAGWHAATSHAAQYLRHLAGDPYPLCTLQDLDALPCDSVIESEGRPATKGTTGAWWYADGAPWEPALPARLVFLGEEQYLERDETCGYCGHVHSDLDACSTRG